MVWMDGRVLSEDSASRARSAIAEAVREPKAEVTLLSRPTIRRKGEGFDRSEMLPAPESQKPQVWLAITETGYIPTSRAAETAER